MCAICNYLFPHTIADSNCTLNADLTKYGSHVYVLVRRDELRASKIMAKRLKEHPKVVRTILKNIGSSYISYKYVHLHHLDYFVEHRCAGMPGRRRPPE